MTLGQFRKKLLEKSENAQANGLSWLLIILFLVLLSFSVVYFGGNSGDHNGASATLAKKNGNNRASRTYSVFYSSGVFSPTNLRIHTGDSVKFQNSSHFPIRILSDKNTIFQNSGEIPVNGFFAYTFTAAGIFDYHNEKNPNEAGTIIVR